MEIELQDLKNLMTLAFDAGWFGFKETKEDCISKIIEDYLQKNPILSHEKLGITVTTTKNNSDYYSYYASSNEVQQFDLLE